MPGESLRGCWTSSPPPRLSNSTISCMPIWGRLALCCADGLASSKLSPRRPARCGLICTHDLPVQFDIHSPALTIRESYEFSAQLRLINVNKVQLQEFVDEVGWSSALQRSIRGLAACCLGVWMGGCGLCSPHQCHCVLGEQQFCYSSLC